MGEADEVERRISGKGVDFRRHLRLRSALRIIPALDNSNPTSTDWHHDPEVNLCRIAFEQFVALQLGSDARKPTINKILENMDATFFSFTESSGGFYRYFGDDLSTIEYLPAGRRKELKKEHQFIVDVNTAFDEYRRVSKLIQNLADIDLSDLSLEKTNLSSTLIDLDCSIPRLWRTPLFSGEDLRQFSQGPSLRRGSVLDTWYLSLVRADDYPIEAARLIAQFDEKHWQKGRQKIAELIAEIEARFLLKARIDEQEREFRDIAIGRFGVGGNNPPEPIEDLDVSADLKIIWAPLEELKAEVEAKTPDKERVRSAINALSKALTTGRRWAASKTDLAVDTTIKWAIPFGGAYCVMNPEKLAAVIEAAKTWLSFLP